MIDLNLFATLIRAVNWNSVQRLILVGDPNQLPPIGRGKVFADAIDWLKDSDEYADSVGVLTENIRQLVNTAEGNGTGILDLANVFIQEKQTTGEDVDATIKLKLEKEEIFTKVLENGNGDVDKDFRIRRLTPVECERLQGFEDNWTKFGKDGELISDTQRYKCCGNAVTTNVITAIVDEMFNEVNI